MATVIEAGAPLLLLVIGDLSGGERVPAQYSFRLLIDKLNKAFLVLKTFDMKNT